MVQEGESGGERERERGAEGEGKGWGFKREGEGEPSLLAGCDGRLERAPGDAHELEPLTDALADTFACKKLARQLLRAFRK